MSQRSESKGCWQGANTQEQGEKDLEFEKPSCLVEALNCTPLNGVRTTNQCEEPQAEMSRLALGQRGAPKHSRAHLRVQADMGVYPALVGLNSVSESVKMPGIFRATKLVA